MLNQNQIDEIIKEKFLEMQDALNSMENELLKNDNEFNKSVVSFNCGRMMEHYCSIVKFLKIDLSQNIDKK